MQYDLCVDGFSTLRNIAPMEKWTDLAKSKMRELKITQERLAEQLGVTQGAIGHWLSGRREPSIEVINKILRELGLPSLSVQGPSTGNTEPAPVNRGNIPLISWVQAGAFHEATEAYAPGMAEAYLPCPTQHGPWTFALKVRGQSMFNPHSPKSFHEGEMIYVDPDREAENGSFVVVKLVDEQEATFKQLVIEGARRYLKAINPSWPEPFIEIDGEAHIVGVVIGKYAQF